jgi:phosphatidylglycerol---prolipoprotein diacylglyceryl transferase
MDSSYLHAIDPFAIKFTETFGIRWYGLAYLAGFVIGYWIIQALCRRGRLLIAADQIADFVFAVALGTIVGGRLGYCLFYSPDLFLRFRPEIPFWGVLAVNEGGMASHGGIIGIVVACYLFGRKRGIPSAHLCDLTTLGGTVGVFFGRMANFVNGELIGRPAAEGVRWSVKFPQDLFLWPSQEPSRLLQLKDLVAQLGVSAEQWGAMLSGLGRDSSAARAVEGVLLKIINEVQSGNQAVAAALRPLLQARYPSQIYEALLEGLLMFILLNLIWLKPRKPGVITGAFLTMYSVVRFIGEQYRMPDAQIGYEIFGLTRGQILSVFVFCFGLAVLIISSRLDRKAVGGWCRS